MNTSRDLLFIKTKQNNFENKELGNFSLFCVVINRAIGYAISKVMVVFIHTISLISSEIFVEKTAKEQ